MGEGYRVVFAVTGKKTFGILSEGAEQEKKADRRLGKAGTRRKDNNCLFLRVCSSFNPCGGRLGC